VSLTFLSGRQKRHFSLILLIVFCLGAFIARAVFFARQDFLLGYDSANYAAVADNLAKGRGFTVDFVLNYYKQYPGISHYEDRRLSINSLFISGFLLVFGKSVFSAKLFNIILGSLLLPITTYYLALSVPFSRRVAFFSGLSVIIVHNLSEQTYTAMADLLFAQFFLLFLISFLRSTGKPSWHYASGIFIGLAFLSKTQGLFLFPVWIICYLIAGRENKYRDRKRFVAGLVLAIVVMMPFLIRNSVLFRDPLYSTIRYQAAYDELFETNTLMWLEKSLKVHWNIEPVSYLSQFLSNGFKYNIVKAANQYRNAYTLVGNIFLFIPLFYIPFWRASRQRLLFILIFLYVTTISLLFAFHDRYEMPVIPILLILCWGFLYKIANIDTGMRIAGRPGLNKWMPVVSSVLLPLLVFGLLHRRDLPNFVAELRQAPLPLQGALVDVARWAKANLPSSAIVMTHDPPSFNFHTGLKCVQIPYDNKDALKSVMQYYGVTYAVPWTLDDERFSRFAKGARGRNINMLLLNPSIPYANLQRVVDEQKSQPLYGNSFLKIYKIDKLSAGK
jgi:hypothetical protein